MLRTLSDETKLWRYMDLSQFLWLITEKRLYFANPQELSDKWEGAWPASIVTEVEKSPEFIRLVQEGVNAKYASQVVASLRNNRQGGYAVNCWHWNDVESIAMWKLYTSGDDGVAIRGFVDRRVSWTDGTATFTKRPFVNSRDSASSVCPRNSP
jgi:hypothetical protein